MKEILVIFNQLQNTSGRIEKENILLQHKNNKQFTNLIHYLLNPYIITGVGKKKLKKFEDYPITFGHEFKDVFDVIEYLKSNNTGSDEVVKNVMNWISCQDEEFREFYKGLVLKNIKLGIQAGTVNKVYGKSFVPKFEVQLAKKFEDEQHKLGGLEFVITEKLDGMRAILHIEDGMVKVFSRQGQPVLELVDIIDEAKTLPNGIYDGELLIANADDYKDRDVLQETLKVTRKDGIKDNLIFHVFDMLPIEEFNNGKSKLTYKQRRVEFERVIGNEYNWLKVLPTLYTGKDLTVIPALLSDLEEQGKEGLILNVVNSLYETKRTSNLLKIKSMNSSDLKVIGFEEGDGKYQGMLGKLVLDYKGYDLGCGTGLSDLDRKEIWDNQDKYTGKIVEINYFRESKSQDGNLSVSFPVFVAFRFDKDEPSYN